MPTSSSSPQIQHAVTANDTNRAKDDAGPRIDAVLFDYGQVLSGPPDAAAWGVLRAVSGLDEARLHAAYWKFRHDYDRGALTGRAYWDAVAADAGVRFDAVQVAALMAADIDVWTQLNLPMVEWAGRLQRAGVRTGILSNIGDAIGEGVVARLPWLAGFDHCVWSHALRMAKPDAGDLPEDRRGAEDRAGQDSVYRRPRSERCRRGGGRNADRALQHARGVRARDARAGIGLAAGRLSGCGREAAKLL